MKAVLTILLSAAAAIVFWQMNFESQEPAVAFAVNPLIVAPPTSVNTEKTEVFRKAFWRQPGAADEILHAERREWTDDRELQKWQWFIAVDASPELLKRLRDDNPFDLRPTSSPPSCNNPPDWFRFSNSDIEFMTSVQGNFYLIMNKTGRRIYATDSGDGFRPGAPELVVDPVAPHPNLPPVRRRLPDSMPPKPFSKSS